MKIPGPDHPITLTRAANRWRVKFAGHVIADTADAIVLQESTYPQVIYFPRADVSMDYMSRTDRSTHCPYKGDASYYTVLMDGQFADNAVWSYETPYPAMEHIAGRLAFYMDKVEVYEVKEDRDGVRRIGAPAVEPEAAAPAEGSAEAALDVILHTDSGSGASQREHWAPNVSIPADAAREDGGPAS